MAKLKFGSPAWRKKYMKKRRRPGRSRVRSGRRNSSHSRGTRAKKTRMREMLKEAKPRKNPPSKWTKVTAFRVVRKGGRKVLEVKR